MQQGRGHRLVTTVLVVLALLFSQFAMANYVCAAFPESVEMPAMQMAAGEACEFSRVAQGKAVDQEQPLLCHQHCADAPQSFDSVPAPVVSLPAVVHVLVVPALLDAGKAGAMGFALAARERSPPPPLFLSTLRLRV